jgi:hypothetical protein
MRYPFFAMLDKVHGNEWTGDPVESQPEEGRHLSCRITVRTLEPATAAYASDVYACAAARRTCVALRVSRGLRAMLLSLPTLATSDLTDGSALRVRTCLVPQQNHADSPAGTDARLADVHASQSCLGGGCALAAWRRDAQRVPCRLR